MDFVVDTTLPANIVIGATGLTGLAQEIRTVLTTRKGSVPLDRDFGVDWSFVDAPLPEVQPRYVGEVARQVEKYVPRVRVLDVSFKSTTSGPAGRAAARDSEGGGAVGLLPAAHASAAEAGKDAAEGKLFPVVRVTVRKEFMDDFF